MDAKSGFVVTLACALALALGACSDAARDSAGAADTADDAAAVTQQTPPPDVLPPPEMGAVDDTAIDDAGTPDDPTDLPVPPAEHAATGTQGIAVGEPNPAAPTVVDSSCRTDADCAIKDVGSCCGYRPQCVNKDSPTFPDRVKAKCAKDGRMGICGFPAITGCQCVSGQCKGTGAEARIQ